MKTDNLRLIVLENCYKFGELVNDNLKKIRCVDSNFIIPISNSRFNNGEGKVKIMDSVREKDIYIISDVGNYEMSYNLHGKKHIISPDEHFQDIKRVISACSGHANRINVVMPLLYQSRQHKRKGRESLDCAIALQELEKLGVNNIISFDVHDPNVSNAIPLLPFENFFPTHKILSNIIDNEKLSNDKLLVISPDMGAMERARYYAEMLNCDVGVFYKRRDLSKIVNGKNPIVEHIYMGASVKNKTILVVDDMIASGSSMIEVSKKLKSYGAQKIILIATFTLLTEGIKIFDDAYKNATFDKLYTTNLSYIPSKIKKRKWFYEVDISSQLAIAIDKLNNKESIMGLFNNKEEILKKINGN